MIKAIKQWYASIRFPAPKYRHTVEVTNICWWVRPHSTRIAPKDEVKEWLTENVKGRYLLQTPQENSPWIDPNTVVCRAHFSDPTEAIAFKLAFS